MNPHCHHTIWAILLTRRLYVTNKPTDQLTNQLTNQPNQPTNKPSDQWTDRPTGQPTNRPTNERKTQRTNQLTTQPTNQPMNEWKKEWMNEWVNQSINRPFRIFQEYILYTIFLLTQTLNQASFSRPLISVSSLLPYAPTTLGSVNCKVAQILSARSQWRLNNVRGGSITNGTSERNLLHVTGLVQGILRWPPGFWKIFASLLSHKTRSWAM